MFDTKSDELAVERGLDIKNYPVKWKQAKDIALRTDKSSYTEGNAFEYCCRCFVELGGKQAGVFYGLLEEEKLS